MDFLFDLTQFIFIAFFILIVVVIIQIGIRAGRGQKIAMQALADDLGLALQGGEPALPRVRFLHWITTPLSIQGHLHGHFITIHSITKGSGKNRQQWTQLKVMVNNPWRLRLHIAKEHFLTRIGKGMGLQDITVGDPKFDETFVVKSSDPAFPTTILIPEIRNLLIKAWDEHAARGFIKLDKDFIIYEERGLIRDLGAQRRFSALARACTQIAQATEIYSRKG